MESAIVKASQFIDEVYRKYGLILSLDDVHIGRLDLTADEVRKDSGYVCFYAWMEDVIFYMKAFKGKTVREAKYANVQDVKVTAEYPPHHAFNSAYGMTVWYVIKSDDDIELVEDSRYRRKKKEMAKRRALPA